LDSGNFSSQAADRQNQRKCSELKNQAQKSQAELEVAQAALSEAQQHLPAFAAKM
jgi:hypothetical protein